MSLETWKAEFYPIPAHEVPVEDAVQHSLRKWRGLTEENLEKHGVSKGKGRLYCDSLRDNCFDIDASSCALCKHYISLSTNCGLCPLVEVLGHRCDETEDEYGESPYHEFTRESNPLPMIEALEKAAALEPDIRSA